MFGTKIVLKIEIHVKYINGFFCPKNDKEKENWKILTNKEIHA
jgi:hypothetical protein